MEKIAIIGAGGHAKVIIDSIEKSGKYEVAGFVDFGEKNKKMYRGYRLLCSDDNAEELLEMGIKNVVIGIGFLGNSKARLNIYRRYKKLGFSFPVIVDETAVIALDVVIEEGSYIGKNAILNSNSIIGKCSIVNTASIIEHDCVVGDFSHVAISSVLCGNVVLGKNVFVGANSTVLQGVEIGDNCMVAAASIVRKSVGTLKMVLGNNIIKDINGGAH